MPKVCVKCGRRKSNDQFNKNASKPMGLQSYCRDCQKTYEKGYYQGSEQRQQSQKAGVYKQRNKNRGVAQMV